MKSYQITKAARGAFCHNGQRVTYDVQPGVIEAQDVDARVLERLIVLDIAAPVKAPMETSKKEEQQ